MTAQAALLTSATAVLAADSAVTVSGGQSNRVYTGVEKIYPLSDSRPLAALVYGSADLAEVPWSTIINEFRSKRDPTAENGLETLGRELLDFAASFLTDHLGEHQARLIDAHMGALTKEVFVFARDSAWEQLEADAEADALREQIAEKVSEVASAERELWRGQDRVEGLTAKAEAAVHRDHRPLVREHLADVFGDLDLSPSSKRRLGDLILLSFTRQRPPGVDTPFGGGLVIAGYADGSLWPGYIEFAVDGVGLTGIRSWSMFSDTCDGPGNSIIRAFAQTEGIATLMNGIHPGRDNMLFSALIEEGVTEASAIQILESVQQTWFQERTIPVLNTLNVLPIPVLCEVAESLVALTGLLHRIRGALETVGGPISVAVLSPGEPLRWAKRPDLMAR